MDVPGDFPVGAVFPSAQGRGARERCIALNGSLQGRIDAQAVMVIEILVTQRQSIDSLT